ncbi:metallophosphoesterase [Vibrio ostreicida]|uniref:Metallophosphoesterase n=1 Tax=Vibrio ostreicida TaxID=526588 RepID=A0ABT8BTR6_9VIBR|nr:metallophosphoesterase [Vibrio ostreicida]MDN3609764.1 metallophosphoesterase [Vibrio ostreicida]NPD09406.1 hypothetical protein [Vibrio ostreicida]
MANNDVRIIQVSDLHLAEDLSFELKDVNTYQSSSQAMRAINAPTADAVVVTGDISEDGSPASYQHFKALCHQHNVHEPHCLPGNHDNLENMTSELKGMPYCESLRLGNWLFIFVNTHRQGFDDGGIGTDEYQRITSLLTRHSEQHVALFMHHHALPTGSAWIDQYQIRDRDTFLAWLRDYPAIRAVITGHIHQTFSAIQEGVAFYGSPSTCVQFVQGREKAEVAELGPGYRELVFRADGEIDTQVIHLSSFVSSNLKPQSLIK